MRASVMQASLQLEGFSNIGLMQFKRGPMRRAFRSAGRSVAKASRKKINSKVGRGSYPAKRTGRMAKSLQVKLGSKGMYAKVQHAMPSPPSKWSKDPRGEAFYPAFLHRGTSRISSRGNWIADALQEQAGDIRRQLRNALNEALK